VILRSEARTVSEDDNCCADGTPIVKVAPSRFFVEAVATVDERGQMVLPKAIRERAGLKAGDKLAISVMEKDGAMCCITLIKSEVLAEMVKDLLGPAIEDVIEGK
jgi:AbrB family looped-hinge helix DNA binding protein